MKQSLHNSDGHDARCEATLELSKTMIRVPNPYQDDDHLLPSKTIARSPQRPAKQRLLTGWRVGTLVSLCGTISVCVFNFIVTIWVWKGPNYEVEGFIGTLFSGNCAKVRHINVWVHLMVNTLSTLLLCASNYCMQVLSAPNREEVDRAHTRRTWLYIGGPSLHNLWRIGRGRVLMWALLMVSSLPLHLMFNSVVFTDLQANNYMVIPTMENWLHGEPYNTSGFMDVTVDGTNNILKDIQNWRINTNDSLVLRNNATVTKYRNVSTTDCFNLYNGQYVSEIGNVYLVQEKPTVWRWGWYLKRNRNGRFIWETNPNVTTKEDGNYTWTEGVNNLTFPFPSSPAIYPANGWRCASHAVANCSVENVNEVPQNRSQWAPYESTIGYCLVERVEEFCKLRFSFLIAFIVIAANIIKAICMGLTIYVHGNHEALVTLGDAVASFLNRPDPDTEGCCLRPKAHVQSRWVEIHPFDRRLSHPLEIHPFDKRLSPPLDNRPVRFSSKQYRWAKAPNILSWFLTYAL
jgi:hypothetical protein